MLPLLCEKAARHGEQVTQGPEILLAAAALLVGSAVLAFAALRHG